MPRLRKQRAKTAQTLRTTAVQAFRSKACRVGFLLGFSGGCLGVVVCLADLEPDTQVRLVEDASRTRGDIETFDAR